VILSVLVLPSARAKAGGKMLLSSFRFANGFILFGCSAAFIVEVMSQLYKREKINKMEKF
jgi:hypothetical protein